MEATFRRILLSVESTEGAQRAARLAIALAERDKAHLLALNVVDPSLIDRLARLTGRRTSEVEAEVEEDGWKYLYYVEGMAVEREVAISLRQERGLPEDVLVRQAKALQVDLLVLGPPGSRPGARRLMQLSLEKVLYESPCPVLVVR